MAKRKRQKRKHSFAPDRGLAQNLPPTLINERNTPQCQNAKFRFGEVSKSTGYSLFASDSLPLSNDGTGTGLRVMALPSHTSLAGSTSNFAITLKDTFIYDASKKRWRAMGRVAEDCEDAWTTASDVTDSNETDNKVGTNARKFVATSSYTGNAMLAFEDTPHTNQDYSAFNRVHFWIKSTLAQESGDLLLRFAQDDTLGGTTADATIPALTADTWVYLALDIDLSSIDSLDSVGLVTSAGFDDTVTQTIRIDDIRASTKYTGTKDDQFTFCSQAGAGSSQEAVPTWFLVLTNGVDQIRTWASGDEFGAITGTLGTGTISTSRVAASFVDTLHLMNNTENSNPIPQRDRFGDTAEIDDWITGVAGFVDSIDTPGGILAATLLGPYLVAYKEDGIVVFQYNGNASPVVDKTSRVTGNQFFATKAIASANNVDYFLTRDNVRMFAGLYEAPPIGDPIRDELLSTFDFSKLNEAHAFVQPGYHRIWFVIPHTDTNADTATKFYTYDYLEKTWTKGEFADYITSSGTFEGGSTTTWAQLTGTWAAQVGAWSDFPAESQDKIVLLGDKDGNTYQMSDIVFSYNDTAIDAEWETKDFALTPDYMERAMRAARVSFVARGDVISLSYSVDSGVTWTEIITDQALTPKDVEYNVALNFSTPKVRFRVHDDTDEKNFFLSSISFEYIFTTTRE